jgi:hypothetical protein
MIMGGERHGEWLTLPDGTAVWLDIRTALTYPLRYITWIAMQSDGGDGTGWRVAVAVHPSLMGPSEMDQVQGAIFRMAMTHWMRAFAEITDNAPDTPAQLFGTDGKPIPTAIHEPSVGED